MKKLNLGERAVLFAFGALILISVILLGCGANPKPNAVFTPPAPLPLNITTFPRIIQVYASFWLRCMLPEDANGTAIFGIEGMFHTAHKPLDRRMYERLVDAPCQQMYAYCGYKPDGDPNIKMTRLTIEPVGECK